MSRKSVQSYTIIGKLSFEPEIESGVGASPPHIRSITLESGLDSRSLKVKRSSYLVADDQHNPNNRYSGLT